MIDHFETCINVIAVDPRLRNVVRGGYPRRDREVKVSERCLGVMDGADDKRDVGAVVAEVPVDTGGTKNLKFIHDIASDFARERSG